MNQESNNYISVANKENIIKGNNYRITILSSVLIRFEYSETNTFNDNKTLFAINRAFPKTNFTVKEDENYLFINNDYFKIEYVKGKPFRSQNRLMPDSNLKVTVLSTDKIWHFDNQEVRNCGGSSYSLDSFDGKVKLKRGLFSFDGFASFDDSNNLIFDNNGNIANNPIKNDDVYLFVYRKDFYKALESYFMLTGYPMMISRYLLGIWWNKNIDYNQNTVAKLINDFQDNELPFSTLLLTKNWYNNFGLLKESGYTFNNESFGNLNNFNTYLENNKIYLGLNINIDDNISAKEIGYPKLASTLKINDNSEIPINVYSLNFMYYYVENLLKPLINNGVDFLQIDTNKQDVYKLFSFNYYAYNFLNMKNRRPILFSKNPGIASHRYQVLYSGQTTVDWQTLKFLPFFNSTAANVGISLWSHDIGGYKDGIEDAELYTRYIQFGTYSPIFRLASDRSEFYKREPWKWDVKTNRIVKDYIRLRHRLIPYLYTEFYNYSTNGIQVVKPLYYDYPELIDEPDYKNEYFFGSEMFVSPVTTPKDRVMNRVVHKVFLPNGVWYDFKTGQKYAGNSRYITFFKDEDYPVFIKAGSIIPMAVLDDMNLNDTGLPETLEIQVFPGRSNSYVLFEDDGVSQMYREGFYLKTNINFEYTKDNYILTMKATDGKSGIAPEKRNYKIRFRNTKLIDNITVLVDGFTADYKSRKSDNDLIVEIPSVPTLSNVEVLCSQTNMEISTTLILNEEINSIISDLLIPTRLKEECAKVMFDKDVDVKTKRLNVRKLKNKGLKKIYIKMFLKLLEFVQEN